MTLLPNEIEYQLDVYDKENIKLFTVGMHQDLHFKSASIIKFAMLIFVCKMIDNNLCSFNDVFDIEFSDIVLEIGKYSPLKDKQIIFLNELIQHMMITSDNTAFDLLYNRYSDTFNEFAKLHLHSEFNSIKKIGELILPNHYTNIDIQTNIVLDILNKNKKEFERYDKMNIDNVHAKDFNDLWKLISFDKFLSIEMEEYIFTTMAKCSTANNRIRKYLPKDILIYSKTGTIPGYINYVNETCYIEYNNHKYILTILTKSSRMDHIDLCEQIALFSKDLLQNYFNQKIE